MTFAPDRCPLCDQPTPHATPKIQKPVREILGELLNGTGYTCEDLRARPRWDAKLVALRIQTMQALRDAGYSVTAIARTLDRDHTTVLAALHMRGRRGGKLR